METTNRASKTSRTIFRIFRDGCPLRSLRARASGCIGSNFPVCPVHFSDSGVDSRRGFESVTTQFVQSRAFVHQHGSWVGSRSGFHLSVASGAFLARFPHALGEFADCHRLRVDGTRSPDRSILHCRGACRYGMDIVCFRTLGGSAARDAKLGAGPHERCRDNDLAGSDSSWGSDLGFSCRYSWSNLCLVRVGDSVPAKSAFGRSTFDQLYT